MQAATNQHSFRLQFCSYQSSYKPVISIGDCVVPSRGDRLTNALKARKVPKLYALAVDMGVDESAISRWKKNGAISTDHVARLCDVLDISVDWLLLGRGNMDSPKRFSASAHERELIALLRALPPDSADHLSRFLTSVVSRRERI